MASLRSTECEEVKRFSGAGSCGSRQIPQILYLHLWPKHPLAGQHSRFRVESRLCASQRACTEKLQSISDSAVNRECTTVAGKTNQARAAALSFSKPPALLILPGELSADPAV